MEFREVYYLIKLAKGFLIELSCILKMILTFVRKIISTVVEFTPDDQMDYIINKFIPPTKEELKYWHLKKVNNKNEIL